MMIKNAWHWIRSIARRGRTESGLDEEMRFHIDQQTAKYQRAGMSAEDARRQALIRFGGLERAKEDARDEIRPALLNDSIRDVRHGLRVLRRAPGFTAAALITLGLGIGATAAIFSVVRTVVLEPLPYHEPDRLITVWETNRGGTVRNVIASANFVDWRERTRTLEHLGMVGPVNLAVIVNGRAELTPGATFSADVFSALGVQPAIGRAYTSEEEYSGTNSLVVLSHEFWQRRLGGRPDVLNSTLALDGVPRTILGIMPPRFTVIGQRADFLIPYGRTLEQLRAVTGRGNSWGIARLREGVTREQAFSEMRNIYADLEREQPQRNARRTVMLIPLQDVMVGELRPALFALIGAVVLVLLVACVNVANLLLARSAAREREVGLRTALGAKRARLVRQMLVESLVLAGAGGLAGLGVAALCHRGLLALVGDRIPVPRLEQMTLDLPVIAFTMIVALLTGLIFGVVPALISTSHANDALRDGGRHGGGRRLHRVLRLLVVVEVAVSLVLLAGAGLLMRSFVKLQNVDPGFRADGVLTAGVQLPVTRYDNAKADSFTRESLSRLAALPGVVHAAGAACAPIPGSCIGTSFWRADLPKPPDGQLRSGQVRPITPSFFKTLAIPQIAGRDFTDADTAVSLPVAIVSASLVREFYTDGDPIGRRLRVNISHADATREVEWTIVGVVDNIKSALDGPVRQTIYVPLAQTGGRNMRLFLKTPQDPMSLATTVAGVLHEMEREAPVEISTLADLVGSSIARPRATSVLVGAFAILALLLAAVGVYGVMAYSVRERTQEIAIRMALGANAMSVFRLVIGQAIRLVLIGVAVGLVAAAAVTRMLERLLFEVEPIEPWTFAATALILLLVATIASYVPARRGMRMAPVDALRAN